MEVGQGVGTFRKRDFGGGDDTTQPLSISGVWQDDATEAALRFAVPGIAT